MRWVARYRRSLIGALVFLFLGLGGCIEYTVETTLNPDGSGVRFEEMVAAEGEDVGIRVSREDFGKLMNVNERDGWSYTREVEDADTLHVFRRETQVRDLASWADVSGKIHITGATTASAGSTVGHIYLGDVHFWNSVKVETGRVPEGTSFTYRETFYWENLVDALIEHSLGYLKRTVEAQYPELSSQHRGEIVGLTRGGLWAAVDQGLFDAGGDDEQELVSQFIDRTAEQAVKIVRQRYPDADEEFFENVLRQIMEDEDDLHSAFIEEKLPGVQLAANSEIVFRLNMPGRVTNSNAHDRDGATLVWEFGAGDAVPAPFEIYAESVVER